MVSRRLPEVNPPLLQGIQQLAGTPGVDAVVGEGIEDFVKRDLHVGEGPGERGAGPERIIEAEDAFHILAPLMIAVVVEAESLTAKGGGAAENAIFLEMVTGTVRHECLLKAGRAVSD
jgi:hypothetical protein